ncbi:MAG TPA: winged helix DNA-binding domain-containing protein [Chloroflexi bacterium]|nr:winged helix DNA-binding domain-containing protein [Chloroflexota bacterium]
MEPPADGHDNLTLTAEQLQAYRACTYRWNPPDRVRSVEEAVEFVNQRGFVFLYANKGVLMPSLWTAVAGNRPVPRAHNDPGQVIWDWKDSSLGKRLWYYSRLLRRRNTLVSLDMLPCFYALSPNYGDPENDYLEQYEQGLMTREARMVYEAILFKGKMNALDLRQEAGLASNESLSRFNRALEDLQVEMKIVPVGVAHVGAWNYAFIYDATHRHFPDLDARTRPIGEWQARETLLLAYLRSVGAATVREIDHVFRWSPDLVRRVIRRLEERGEVRSGIRLEGGKDTLVAHLDMLDHN